ncbi:hypothetical protein SNOG_04974 [Parastagonospora nodorum SN15]|uniref:Uncharacterized protein n=1 Tax=Phaeosphaeria nodorum (strain SN15 / ATCC MYA-4574 / FGSC 10173) TaxID=321614 RepID=Q0UTE0_PHANO|nr:hypothetical protein SNOG_04974 [Parastagonospora nodorum SN15]EAT87365.1 hypothetical protein SNOG_04974 [Parastagonospora nodorum SN15]
MATAVETTEIPQPQQINSSVNAAGRMKETRSTHELLQREACGDPPRTPSPGFACLEGAKDFPCTSPPKPQSGLCGTAQSPPVATADASNQSKPHLLHFLHFFPLARQEETFCTLAAPVRLRHQPPRNACNHREQRPIYSLPYMSTCVRSSHTR